MWMITCTAVCCRRVPLALLSSQKRCRSMVSSLRFGAPEAECLNDGSDAQPYNSGSFLQGHRWAREVPVALAHVLQVMGTAHAFRHAADVWLARASRAQLSARFAASHELASPVLACVSTLEASCATALQPLLLSQGSIGSSDCV